MAIMSELKERANRFFMVIEDVAITHLSFSDEFSDSVEAKQVAQQNAERAKYLVMKAIYDKQSTIVKAQGDAISAELIGKSMNLPYLELKRVETAVKIAKVLVESKNITFIDTESILLNIMKSLEMKLLKLNKEKEEPNKPAK